MKPNPLRFTNSGEKYGELNKHNELHGRGISIDKYGDIQIGFFAKGSWTGNYIRIESDGVF